MCTIEKMLIKGIRSFSPDNGNVIEFYKPLTLIVGSNGAGKTTIIECLKQACTGELPPNVGGNGRNWVMDPKVAGETEVKAQIKLRMRNNVQMPFVVVRSFQSVQKKATLQFKSLDCLLQTYNRETNAKEAMTYRCADINVMVPSIMNVSKAVLDNVIFVHQEESNWPLADGATIKKKFDEIFAATKYTKALETLRKLRLEKAQEAREMKLRLETLKSHKDAAARLTGELRAGERSAGELREQIRRLQAEIDARHAEVATLDGQLNTITTLLEQAAKLEAQAEVVKRATADKLARLDGGVDPVESDERLEDAAATLALSAVTEAEQRAGKVNRLKTKQLDVASYDEALGQLQQQLSRLAAAAEAHASNVADRDAFVRQTASKYGLDLASVSSSVINSVTDGSADGSASGQLPAFAIEGVLTELRGRVAALQEELRAAKEAHRGQEAALAGAIDAANAELAAAQQGAAVKRTDLAAQTRRKNNLHQQSLHLVAAPFQAEDLQVQAEELGRKLEAKRTEQARLNVDGQLAEQRRQQEQLAASIAALRSERDTLVMVGDAAARLRSARNALAAAKAKQEALLSGPGAARLLALIGHPQPLPHGAELKRQADAQLKARDEGVKAKAAKLRQLEAEAAKASGELTSRRRERLAAEGKAQDMRGELRRLLSNLPGPLPPAALDALGRGDEPVAFSATLAALEQVQAAKSKKKQVWVSMRQVLESFVVDSRTDCACALCHRPFESAEQLEAALEGMTAEVEELPGRIQLLESELADLEGQLRSLNSQRGTLQALEELEKGLPALRQREADVVAASEAQNERVESLREELALAEVELASERSSIGDAAWQLARQATEVDELTAAVDKAAAAAAAAGSSSAGGRDISDVDAELAVLEGQQRQVEGTRDELLRRQGRIKDDRVRLSERLAAVREELRQAADANRARVELVNQMKQVSELVAKLEADIAAAAAAVGPAQTRRDNLLAQRDALRGQQAAAEAGLEGQIKELAAALDGYATKQRLVDGYAAPAKAQEAAGLEQQAEELRAKRDAAAQEAGALQAELDNVALRASEQERLRLQVEATLDYRHSRAQLAALEGRIAGLREQSAQVGDREQLTGARYAGEAARDELRQQQHTARGRLSVVEENAKAAQRGLADPRYHQIQPQYRKQLIELKTTEMAAADLDKYHKALERALLAFHTGKMCDINKIVRELWQKTYRSADIDYIQIKADAEGTARSYNYRVVMVNGGVELDMRGRCSAGQKVLACLIIRLALAETFCLNCGILALDEPTTNLDAENTASLAEALRAVMAARRGQDNFQLVVITHDEHFATLIGTREHAEFMWRITKDDAQRSHIAQEAIVE